MSRPLAPIGRALLARLKAPADQPWTGRRRLVDIIYALLLLNAAILVALCAMVYW